MPVEKILVFSVFGGAGAVMIYRGIGRKETAGTVCGILLCLAGVFVHPLRLAVLSAIVLVLAPAAVRALRRRPGGTVAGAAGGIEQRRHPRHLIDLPVQVHLQDVADLGGEFLVDISCSGMRVRTSVPVHPGKTIGIQIPVLKPVFIAQGVVVWCRENSDRFDVGIEFTGDVDAFKTRMVEQICCIERYKRDVLAREGRALTGSQAAMEWIGKYAKDFGQAGCAGSES